MQKFWWAGKSKEIGIVPPVFLRCQSYFLCSHLKCLEHSPNMVIWKYCVLSGMLSKSLFMFVRRRLFFDKTSSSPLSLRFGVWQADLNSWLHIMGTCPYIWPSKAHARELWYWIAYQHWRASRISMKNTSYLNMPFSLCDKAWNFVDGRWWLKSTFLRKSQVRCCICKWKKKTWTGRNSVKHPTGWSMYESTLSLSSILVQGEMKKHINGVPD